MNRFYPTAEIKPGIHPTAVIGKDVEPGRHGVASGRTRVIGDGTRMGMATSIGAGCSIGKRVVLGEGCMPERERHGLRQRGHRPRRDSAFGRA